MLGLLNRNDVCFYRGKTASELADLVKQPFSVLRNDGGAACHGPVGSIVAVLQPASTMTGVLVGSASMGAPSSGVGGGAADALITQRAGVALRARNPDRRTCVAPGDTGTQDLFGGLIGDGGVEDNNEGATMLETRALEPSAIEPRRGEQRASEVRLAFRGR